MYRRSVIIVDSVKLLEQSHITLVSAFYPTQSHRICLCHGAPHLICIIPQRRQLARNKFYDISKITSFYVHCTLPISFPHDKAMTYDVKLDLIPAIVITYLLLWTYACWHQWSQWSRWHRISVVLVWWKAVYRTEVDLMCSIYPEPCMLPRGSAVP